MTAEELQRARVVAEVRAWRGAAYHHMARVRPNAAAGERGAVDCAQLLACVYHAAGLIPEVPLEYYPPDWHLHRGLERYLNKVAEHAREIQMTEGGRQRTDAIVAVSSRAVGLGRPSSVVCCPLSGPGPGDLVLWRWGRCFAHGAIVTQWPRVVHAMAGIGVLEEDIERNGTFRGRPRRFFTLW